jgi:hypothetical protein
MTKTSARRTALVAAGAAAAFALAACGSDSKTVEQYKDAGVSSRNDAPAEVGTMPDGFSNWASKCDGPNRVYTVFHYNNAKDTGGDVAGAIAVVANDPRCTSK